VLLHSEPPFVIALAFAYRRNYATQQALTSRGPAPNEIAKPIADLPVLKGGVGLPEPPRPSCAIWAELNFDRLNLFRCIRTSSAPIDQVKLSALARTAPISKSPSVD